LESDSGCFERGVRGIDANGTITKLLHGAQLCK
jgi:hypothetical protein